jgi:hypothetical protein
LEARAVSPGLRISIKVMLDVLRSALDYCAQELFERYGDAKGKGNPKVYFPIWYDGPKAKAFPDLVEHNIPGLAGKRPDLMPVLESFQKFASPDNSWLLRMHELCNTGKHNRLTGEMKRQERVVVEYRFGQAPKEQTISRKDGHRVDSRPAPEIVVPPLVVLATGGGHAMVGGVPISSGQPIPCQQTATIETWTAVVFDETGERVIPFIEMCINGVGRIVEELLVRLPDPASVSVGNAP